MPRASTACGFRQSISQRRQDPVSLCPSTATMSPGFCPGPSVSVRLIKRIKPCVWYTGRQEPGTAEFSGYGAGETLRLIGPLGNGFPLDKGYKKVFLIGGGIGVPPMVELSKQLPGEKIVVSGYRGGDLFLKDELSRHAELVVATEDGSAGTKGNVLDAIKENGLTADAIFACGPGPMLRALKAYAEEQGIDCYLSLEERMACGIGACLACVCKSKDVDAHTNVKNKRICKDGPVFAADEIEL